MGGGMGGRLGGGTGLCRAIRNRICKRERQKMGGRVVTLLCAS